MATPVRLPILVGAASLSLHAHMLPAAEVRGLYVHVPFCSHKCHYCDFYSITRQAPERMERFVDLVLREADRWTAAGDGPLVRPRTIFFGGGTPSLLPIAAMRRLLDGLRRRFDMGGLEEWTIECNPDTVSDEYCAMLCEQGVDRLSFGAQSFVPGELRMLERHHDPENVHASVAMARKAGFRRINVDLIYAIPGQDLASWSRSLELGINLATEHISCYALTYEPNTPMAVRKRLGAIGAVEDDLELRMLHHARGRLREAGYQPYEISNYARPGEECGHNLLYWNGESYIGLGPSAASHVEGWRWRNRPHLGEWERAVEAGGIPTTDVEQLTPIQRAGELAMLQLRLERGVEFEQFANRTGVDARLEYADLLQHLARIGMIQRDQRRFRLTDAGVNVADAVAAEFLK